MLVLKHNSLPFEKLVICEKTMLSFKDNKLTSLGMHFNVWDWSIPELYGIVLGMMVKLDLSECLQIRNSEMLDFIIDVEKGYHDTEYHSFYHAVDVVAVLYYMLTDLGAAKYLTPLDSICLMIAGLCHDIGHPGLNNVYQVNAKTPLAIKYNNQSVLENYSCALTMELLTKHKLFRNLHSCNIEFLETELELEMDDDNDDNNSIDSCCYSSNSSIASSPESSPISTIHSSSPSSSSSSFLILDQEQREIFLKVLLHAADLSNTVRPWDISKHWSDCVVEEFFKQGDLEKQKHLPVSPNMDREQAQQPQISLGFGDFVVKPYFEAFAFLSNVINNNNTSKIVNNTSNPTNSTSRSVAKEILSNKSNKKPKPDNIPLINIINNNNSEKISNETSKNPATLTNSSSTSSYSSTSMLPPSPPAISITIPTSTGQRRVSLAAGLLIIPDDIQEKLQKMMQSSSSFKNRRTNANGVRLKRSLSGRSYRCNCGVIDVVDNVADGSMADNNSGCGGDVSRNSSTRNNQQHHQKCISNNNSRIGGGRMRRSSSLDHNMIRQITSTYGSSSLSSPSPTSQASASQISINHSTTITKSLSTSSTSSSTPLSLSTHSPLSSTTNTAPVIQQIDQRVIIAN
ncbi:6139_t:CDS:2 [Entrophospora sp. SA101]|nr:438_t:CDS:2 [Entrophospora sp. SA101]CAJ0829522.1 2951_t:CDS:2 [Entrophospora sp. SA101]CAJ0876879.1 6139_t:CDS:2 [Entrophospora sp. SA101]